MSSATSSLVTELSLCIGIGAFHLDEGALTLDQANV